MLIRSTVTLKQRASHYQPSRQLGAHLDKHQDTKVQVSRTTSICSLHLRNIGLVHRYLTQPTAERVLNAMVASRLVHCNTLAAVRYRKQ